MKIAILSSGFLPVVDGVTVTVWHRIQVLSQSGHQVLLFCPDYSPIEAVYPNWRQYVGDVLPGVTVVSLSSAPFMGLEFERNVSGNSYQTVLQNLTQFQPDIIHVDEPDRLFLGWGRSPGVDFARRANIPCVAFFHTNFIEYIEDYFALPGQAIALLKLVSKVLISRNYNSYDLTLTASQTTHKKLTRMGIRNVRNGDFLGVDIHQFQPTLRAPDFFQHTYQLAGVDQKIKLIFLGRLTPDKGWNFIMRALPHLAQIIDVNSIAVIIAGDGSMREDIARHLEPSGLKVDFIGRVPPEQVPALLLNSDIHITASEKETRGLTLLEAFAAGVPVIAPRAGGVVDSIQDGWNGLLFQPQNPEDFIDKLVRLIHHPDLRQVMGLRGRASVAEHSWEKVVNNLVTVWEEQLDRKQPR